MRYQWEPKDPEADKDYHADWTAWLAGDTISTVTWTVPSGLTEGVSSNTNTVASVWLSGGSKGQAYEVKCRITTAGGRTDERTVILPVAQQ